VLSDLTDIAFKVDNFNSANMSKIEQGWDAITKSLRLAIELAASYGYNYQNLTSSNATIPIAYYIFKKSCPDNFVQATAHKEDREKIRKWLAASLIKRAFSGQPDNVLRPIRNIMQNNSNGFPFTEIISKFKGTNKAITFTEDDIEALLYAKYGKAHTFSVLAMLYPTLDSRNRFHQDHIFPKSSFRPSTLKKRNIKEDQQDFYLEHHDYIGNLQLLEGLPNEQKSDKDFKEWIEQTYPDETERKEYMQKHYIPQDTPLDFDNFETFIQKRNELLAQKLQETLS